MADDTDIKLPDDDEDKLEPVVVELEPDDKGSGDDKDAKPEGEGRPEGGEDDLASTVAALKGQVAAERARAEAAERRAGAAEGDANRAQANEHQRNIDLVTSGIAVAEQNLKTAKAAYIQARQDGDLDAEANALDAMNEARTNKTQLEAGLTQLKAMPAPQRQASDPVEKLIASTNMTPRAASWLRAHPEYVTDPKKNQRLLAAHNMAVTTEGIKDGSDEYYDLVEGYLGTKAAPAREERRQEAGDTVSEGAHATGGRSASAPPAAPVTRGGGPGSPPGSRNIHLNPAQREAAHYNFPELSEADAEREYAKNLRAIEREKVH